MPTATRKKKTDAEPKPMTAEEFYAWVRLPENRDRSFELVRGQVIDLSAPSRLKGHGFICANSTRILGNYTFERRKGYVISNNSCVILQRNPDTVRGPDVAVYDDVDTFADLPAKYGETPPRLAVEVLSLGDKASVVLQKITDYLNCGVKLVWLVDPEDRAVFVHRRDRPLIVAEEVGELTGDDILPGLRCRVADLFSLPGEHVESAPRKGKRPRS